MALLSSRSHAQFQPVANFDVNAPEIRTWECCYSTQGWNFAVVSPITVSALGWYDIGADGLVDDHLVGIWGQGAAPMLVAMIPWGDKATLVDSWRVVGVPETLLPVGDYVIGGYVPNFQGDQTIITNFPMPPTVTFHPSIDFKSVSFAVSIDRGFFKPDATLLADGAFLSPTFLTIPEPSCLGPMLTMLPFISRRRNT